MDGPLAALQEAGKGVRSDDDLAAVVGLLGVQRLDLGPALQGVGGDTVSAESVGVPTQGGGYDDAKVVLAGGPTDGAGIDAGLDGVAADGGVDAPARQNAMVAVCDGEYPTGVVCVEDAAGAAGEWCSEADTLKKGRRDRGVRYRDSSSLARGEHATALGGDAAYSKVVTGWYRSRI